MKKVSRLLSLLFCFALLATACTEKIDDEDVTGGGEQMSFLISLPEAVSGAAGDIVSVKFYSGKGPKEGDSVVLKNSSSECECEIVAITADNFSFRISPQVSTGKYTFSIKRGAQIKTIGEVNFTIEKRVEIVEKEGYNVYGLISCDGVGVPGVVVSDGVEVTTTDENGLYYLKSDEYYKLVFMSVPSGYETVTDTCMPKFHKVLDGNSKTTERADWQLTKVDNKDHVMYLLGDMHLANRTNDASQFATFLADIKEQITANKSKRQYALTLGDMTWDLYWYDNAYDLTVYVEMIKKKLSGLQIFHTIGNHDHDMNEVGDFNTVTLYRKTVAPTYYSFNIGDVHYVVLDDILCKNTGTGGSGRKYESTLTTDQLSWLKKDLAYVDKSKTLVITMHAQMYNENNAASLSNASELASLCSGYKTHVMSAHTHVIWNNDFSASSGIVHHNSGAICGTWWWTGYYTPELNLCKDGSPAGYYVYQMNGTDVKWRFKPTGRDFNYAFRTYDRNKIVMTAANFAPNASSTGVTNFEKSASSWSASSKDNYVYINVFDYDKSWKIEVTENGKSLTPELVSIKDPLHLVTYEAKRYNAGSTPTSDFKARTVTSHIFRVKASSASSTLEISVTDRFGNVSTESMKRPREFSINEYKK